MSYEAYLSETFQKCIKILKKKYRRVKDDLYDVIQSLEENPSIGDPIPGWKKEIWKIRVTSSDIKKGKRSGFRLIYLWKKGDFRIYLLAVYFKGIKEEISKTEIESLLKKLTKELK
ncbi:MAG: type II toxin-antitoxin system RelE/ParE family toxin [Thermodesulfobacteriota bacterium]|nr:type II toxin-antitoxin system RelE/ParE family toxin [Thermodesulfobacteriota bacterium]